MIILLGCPKSLLIRLEEVRRQFWSISKNYGIIESESEVVQSVQLFATPWTAAYQAPLSMGLSRQEYWSGVPSVLLEVIMLNPLILQEEINQEKIRMKNKETVVSLSCFLN